MFKNSPLAWGVVLALLGFLCRALELAATRTIRTELPAIEVAFFRFSMGLMITGGLLKTRGLALPLLPKSNYGVFLFRNVCAIVAMLCLVISLPFLPLGTATTIYYLNPLFITLGAAIFLKEPVRRFVWLAIGLGFFGVTLVASPEISSSSWAVALVALGALFVAPADLALKELRKRGHSSLEALISYFSCGSLMLLPLLPLNWKTPSIQSLFLLLCVALLAAFFQWCLGEANALMDANVVAPFKFSILLWSQLLDISLLGVYPSAGQLLGMSCIIGAGILASVAVKKVAV